MRTMETLQKVQDIGADIYREYRKKCRDACALLDKLHTDAVYDNDTPESVVDSFAEMCGESFAEIVIASLVNQSAWDGRISPKAAEWAKGIKDSWDAESSRRWGITTTMHMCHLDQTARSFMTRYNR